MDVMKKRSKQCKRDNVCIKHILLSNSWPKRNINFRILGGVHLGTKIFTLLNWREKEIWYTHPGGFSLKSMSDPHSPPHILHENMSH